MQSTCRLAWRVIFNRSRDRSVVLCLSILDAGACVRECMCVYTHTHAHTAHGVLDVSPGVGTRHLEGPKNPDRLNLSKHVFVFVYNTKYTCVYICCEAGLDLDCLIFFLNIFFLSKKQSKTCDR